MQLSPSVADLDERMVAGPILRRLTRTSVCVWVALRTDGPVRLRVRRGEELITDSEEFHEPVRVGVSLWVLALSVEMPGGFTAGVSYEYWLEGTGLPAMGAPAWAALSDRPNQLGAHPSFVGLPAELGDLRVATTSCRKPHGHGRDALPQLAERLGPDERPHLLLLGGDQVYADDVSNPLMQRVQEIAATLVGVDESGVFNLDALALTLLGGRRNTSKAYVAATGKNHLWTLGEYLAMYLLAWSDALWPSTWPDGEAAADSHRLYTHRDLDTLELAPAEVAERRRSVIDDWNDELGRLRAYQLDLPRTRRVLANVPSLMVFDDHEISDDWNLDYSWVRQVGGNPQGRRIVANGMLAYTLCQHWGNVPERFATEGAPEREVLLSAWVGGASPQDAAMLDRLAVPRGIVSVTGERVDLRVHEVPVVGPDAVRLAHQEQFSGEQVPGWASGDPPGIWIPYALPVPEEGVSSLGWSPRDAAHPHRIRYDYRLGLGAGLPVEIVVLDERTCRHFPHVEAACERVAAPALVEMWPDPPDGESSGRVTLLVCAAPLLGLPLLEHIVQPIASLGEHGLAGADFEGWGASVSSFERVLRRAHDWGRVVVLSGDVHFGYTRYADVEKDARHSRLTQFCVSSSKNADDLTTTLHLLGHMATQTGLLRTRSFRVYAGPLQSPPEMPGADAPVSLPWDDAADLFTGRLDRVLASPTPVVPEEVAEGLGLGSGTYRYTLVPVDDPAFFEDPLSPEQDQLRADMVAIPAPNSGWDPAVSLAAVKGLRALDLHRTGRVLQGLPMVGIVHFSDAPAPTATLELLLPAGAPFDEMGALRTEAPLMICRTEVAVDPPGGTP